MSFNQRIITIIAIVVVSSFALSCASDEERFKSDPLAVAKIRTLTARVDAGSRLSVEEFSELKEFRKTYPEVKAVNDLYEKALVLRQDWATLEDYYVNTLGEHANDEQKKTLAKVYFKQGKYEQALVAANKFDVNAEPEMRLVAGNSLFYLGKYDESKALIDKNWDSIQQENTTDLIVIRAMIHFYQGEKEKAVEKLEAIKSTIPDNIPVNNALARIYASMGESEKAEASLKQVQESFDAMTKSEDEKTTQVEKYIQLEQDYKAKKYENVIVTAKQLLPQSKGRTQALLYQYLYNSYRASGRETEARELREEIKQSQQK